MSTKCLECEHEFSLHEALCEDWRDPEKSFVCPNCGTFYKKEMRPQYRSSLIVGIMAGGVATPAAMIVGTYFSSGDKVVLFLGGAILFSCFAILVLSSLGKVGSEYELEKIDS
jgi:hypothetical protein